MRLFRTIRASGTRREKSAARRTGWLLGKHAAGIIVVHGTDGQTEANSGILPASRLRRTGAYQSGARRATGDSRPSGKRSGGGAEHDRKDGNTNPQKDLQRTRGGEEDRGDEVGGKRKWRPEVRRCRQSRCADRKVATSAFLQSSALSNGMGSESLFSCRGEPDTLCAAHPESAN
jgi:hypothetical protein